MSDRNNKDEMGLRVVTFLLGYATSGIALLSLYRGRLTYRRGKGPSAGTGTVLTKKEDLYTALAGLFIFAFLLLAFTHFPERTKKNWVAGTCLLFVGMQAFVWHSNGIRDHVGALLVSMLFALVPLVHFKPKWFATRSLGLFYFAAFLVLIVSLVVLS